MSEFVIGYVFNDETKMYDVYINNEKGRHHVRKSTENEILKIFQKLAKEDNKCVIIVTHSKNVCDKADVVYDLIKNKN